MIPVKICGITQVVDAEIAVENGASAIGASAVGAPAIEASAIGATATAPPRSSPAVSVSCTGLYEFKVV